MRPRPRTVEEQAEALAELQDGLREVFDVTSTPMLRPLPCGPIDFSFVEFRDRAFSAFGLPPPDLRPGGINIYHRDNAGHWGRGWRKER